MQVTQCHVIMYTSKLLVYNHVSNTSRHASCRHINTSPCAATIETGVWVVGKHLALTHTLPNVVREEREGGREREGRE